MAWIAGADGCADGWFRASRETETGELQFNIMRRASALVMLPPRPQVLAIDIPIGLPQRGARNCDKEARACLGPPRQSSVFPAPVRPAIRAEGREEASQITEQIDGRRVGAQAWGIYPKIREVDELLRTNNEAKHVFREVHPEVCFWAWNSGKPMEWSKRTPAGKAERLRLAHDWLGAGLLEKARGTYLKGEVADDDILDAMAALWTATRIFFGKAETLPAKPPPDETGLRMEIVY